MLFGGFSRCLYPLQKFDSDTERRFSIILDRDALKWFKPAKGQFQIYYKLGTEQPEYIPDFVAETDTTIYMVETKARTDVNTQEVQAKANSAARWCKHASTHAGDRDRCQIGKSVTYLDPISHFSGRARQLRPVKPCIPEYFRYI
jgi:type III restriction enzyme